ncbi:hypothetical protein [Nakamurella deserti]|uniref:hypothetical protein n=1 Tax=Nakamurella deserti TaxID=2164074 RepID=UPI001300A40D|nr:hypothetical protein [Nakamurella deserti]
MKRRAGVLTTVLGAALGAVVLAGCAADPVVPAPPTSLAELDGRSFELAFLFTDTGSGRYRPDDDARMVLTFGPGSARADTHCGTIEYPVVRQLPPHPGWTLELDFGSPPGTDCRMGPDPAGTQISSPSGSLFMGVVTESEYFYLTNGTTGWYLREI